MWLVSHPTSNFQESYPFRSISSWDCLGELEPQGPDPFVPFICRGNELWHRAMTRFCAGGSNINARGSVSVSARTAATSSWENGEAMDLVAFWCSTCTVHRNELWECHSCISKTTAQLERLALTKSHCCGYMLILQRRWIFSCWTSTPFIQSEQAIPNKSPNQSKELHQNTFLDDVAAHHITSPLGFPYCHASKEKSGAAIADGRASNSLACPVSKSICKPRTAAYSALKGQGSARRPTTKPKASCGKIWPAWHGGMAHQQTQGVFQKKFKMVKGFFFPVSFCLRKWPQVEVISFKWDLLKPLTTCFFNVFIAPATRSRHLPKFYECLATGHPWHHSEQRSRWHHLKVHVFSGSSDFT